MKTIATAPGSVAPTTSGLASAGDSSLGTPHGAAPILPAVPETTEQITTRLLALTEEQTRLDAELKRRSEEEGARKIAARREVISTLPSQLGLPDQLSVIRLLADHAGVEMRMYRTGASKPTPHVGASAKVVSPAQAPFKPSSKHGKGYRLPEHANSRLLELLRMRRDGKSTVTVSQLMRQFGIRGQSIYARIERINQEGKGKGYSKPQSHHRRVAA